MQFGLVILSVACFSCLIPSALSFNLLAAKAVASQAAEDVVAIKAKAIAAKKEAVAKAANEIASIAVEGVARKGEAIKNAATSIAAAVINSTMSIGATLAKAGLNMLVAKLSGKPTVVFEPPKIVVQPPVFQNEIVEETLVQEPVVVEYDQAVQVPIQMPPVSSVSVDVNPQIWEIPASPQLSQSVWTMNDGVPTFEVVGSAKSPYLTYEIVQSPQLYGPVIETFQWKKK